MQGQRLDAMAGATVERWNGEGKSCGQLWFLVMHVLGGVSRHLSHLSFFGVDFFDAFQKLSFSHQLNGLATTVVWKWSTEKQWVHDSFLPLTPQ